MSNAYEQYRQTSIQTAPPEQLVVMLYDGAIRFLEQARLAMSEGRDATEPLGRAQDIIVELLTSLDRSVGEVADNLARLYEFWLHWLFQALVHRNPARIEEVLTMVRELREAWATIAQQKKSANGGQQRVSAINARG